MDYSLRALVGSPAVLASATREHPLTRIVPLTHGLALIPLGDVLLKEIELGNEAATSVPGFLLLSSSLMAWVVRASEAGPIAYIEAEYYEAVRSLSASVWDKGRIALGPLHEKTALTRALAHLGVADADPFTALGLDRFRSTEEWLD